MVDRLVCPPKLASVHGYRWISAGAGMVELFRRLIHDHR